MVIPMAFKRLTFVKNAAILTATSLLLRTIGIFFRVYLSNKIGAEGMGLYQLIVSIYVLASTFATSGICTAVTRLIAERVGGSNCRAMRRVLRRAIVLSLAVGLISTGAVLLGAEWIARVWLQDLRAVPALRVLSLGLPFMGVSSCLRGYFIARRQVSSTTHAQLFEQIVRMGVIFLLIDRFAVFGLSAACAAVMIGDTLAETLSCAHLGISFWRDQRKLKAVPQPPSPPGRPHILRKLLTISLPITAGRYLNTALRTIENLLVPDRLARYSGSKEDGLSQFGMLKGMAMPILFFPSSFLSALSQLLIPEISEAAALRQTGKVNRAVSHTLRVTLLLSIPISGLFTLFSQQLGLIIYDSEEVGFLIGVLGPIMPFMYLESVVDGLLKGLDQQMSSLRYSVLDSVLRIGFIFFLVPARGMQGFLFVMLVSNVLTSWLNIRRLLVTTHVRLKWGQWIFKPLLAMTAGGAAALGVYRLIAAQGLPLLLSTGTAGLAAVVIYALLLFVFGCVSPQEFHRVKRVK